MEVKKISVIVPVYNGEAVIADCIASILNSSVGVPVEVIIVNDGSTDNTAEVVSKFPINLVTIQKAGVAKARNTGIKMATGDVILFFDADVILLENTLERFLYHFSHDPDVYVVQGRWAKTHPSKVFSSEFLLLRFTFNIQELFVGQPRLSVAELMSGCCGIRREVFATFPGFDENYKFAGGEEFEFGMRLISKFKIYYYPDIFVYHKFGSLWQTAKKVSFRTTNYAMLVFNAEQKREFLELTANSTPARDKRSIVLILLISAALLSSFFIGRTAVLIVALLLFAYILNIRQFLRFLYVEKDIWFVLRGIFSDIFMMTPRFLGLARAGLIFYVFRRKNYKI